jgi:FMN phosphatase YigB (HAD superfamily)
MDEFHPGVVLFDLDNTLVDRQSAYKRWARSFATTRGLDATAVDLLCELDADGLASRRDVFGPLREVFHLADSVDELIDMYRATYVSFYGPESLVLKSLRDLRTRGWKIGVATNGPPSQREKLELTHISQLIDGCCISEELGVAKPDRRMFDAAILSCTSGEGSCGPAIMVGDNPVADIAGGKAAGLQTIWLHRGRTWDRADALPDAIVGSVIEAVEYILNVDAAF